MSSQAFPRLCTPGVAITDCPDPECESALAQAVRDNDMPTHDGWIQTYSGGQFWPCQPRAEDVRLEDIAHALSLKARYEGHTKRHYSVALHSICCCLHAPDHLRLAALLHDASEAYMPDVARPTKVQWGAVVKDTEALLHQAVYDAFGLGYMLPLDPQIKVIDNRMLVTERRDLMNRCTLKWGNWAEQFPAYDEVLTYQPMMLTKGRFIRHFFLQYHLEISNRDSQFWQYNTPQRANQLFRQFHEAVNNCGKAENIFGYHDPNEQWEAVQAID